MTAVGAFIKGLGRGYRQCAVGRQAGPASYVGPGGFTIATGLTTLDVFIVKPDNDDILAASLVIYALRVTNSSGTLTVKIFFAAVTTGTQATWAELANATDVSSKTFNWFVTGV